MLSADDCCDEIGRLVRRHRRNERVTSEALTLEKISEALRGVR